MTLASVSIPYEKQKGSRADQMCGAAALCMVYRSLGVSCSQEEVWPRIGRRHPTGAWSARTYRLAGDALEQGLGAMVLQARQPWAILQRCREHSVRAILNHRVERASLSGHYSVLVDVDDKQAVVHDPLKGPDRRLSQAELLWLWQPLGRGSDITGNVLVAVADKETRSPTACAVCGRPVPASLECSRCRRPIPLHPPAVLGCIDPDCTGRSWGQIFCPHCDSCHVGPPSARPGQGNPFLGGQVMSLQQMMEQVVQTTLEAHQMALAARETPLDADMEGYLNELRAQIQKDCAALAEAERKAQEQQAAIAAALAARRAEVEKAAQLAQAARAAVPPPPQPAAPAAPAIDPQLGQLLRKELLERFGNQQARAKPSDSRDIWQDWQ
jgi:hypothetical protein